MEIEKIFKNLIFVDFAILILIVISSMYQPAELSEIHKYLDKGFLSNFDTLRTTISVILFFLYLLTLNLLYRFISYGRQLYLFLIVSGLILNYLNGSVVHTSFSGILDQIGGIISGAILILLYFSPIRENFNRK